MLANEVSPPRPGYDYRAVEHEGFVGSNFERNVTKFAPHKALKLTA